MLDQGGGGGGQRSPRSLSFVSCVKWSCAMGRGGRGLGHS